jgi:hypothetical protein
MLPLAFVAAPADAAPADGDAMISGWRFCSKCAAMIWPFSEGSCAAGGAHAAEGWTFQLPYGGYPVQNQDQWRWCMNCSALYYAGYDPTGLGDDGLCPATGSVHEHMGQDLDFNLPYNIGQPASYQDQWRFCGRAAYGCFMLFFNGYDGLDGRPYFTGACPAGPGGHLALGYDFAIPVSSYDT